MRKTVKNKVPAATLPKKQEFKLNKSMRLLFDMAPNAYYLNDMQGKFIDGNTAAEELTGYTREELIGKSFLKLKLLPADQLPKALKALKRNKAGKSTGPDNFRLVRKDGSLIFVEIRTQPIELNGQVFVLGSARDLTQSIRVEEMMRQQQEQLEVTISERTKELKEINRTLRKEIAERERSERALRESEEKFRHFIETSTDIVFQLNKRGKIEYVSPQVKSLYGYEPDRLTGKHLRFTTPPAELKKAVAALKTVLDGETLRNFEIEQKDIEGRLIKMEINVVPIRRDNKIAGLQGIMRDITERKRAEKILRASEEKYRDLVEKADIGILVDDFDGKFIFCNKRFADFFGYNVDEILKMSIEELVHPDDIARVMKFHKDRVGGSNIQPMYEFKCVRRDGSIIFLEVDATPIKQGTKFIGTRSYLWDVTDRKVAEFALQKSEKRFRELYNNMRDGMVVFNNAGRIVECNKAYLDMLGYSKDQLFSMKNTDVTPKRWHNRDAQIIRSEVIPRGYSDIYEKEYIRENGTRFAVEIRTYSIKDDGDTVTGIWAVVRDITQRKKIEKEVNILVQTVKSVQEGVAITDLSANIVFVNEAFLKLYGYEREEVIGKAIQEVISGKNTPQVLKKIIPVTLEGGWQGELYNTNKEGNEFPVFLSTSIIYDENKQPVAMCGVVTDISERKTFEEQFRQSQKMEAIGQLAGGIAHDFNNILTAINGYAELALMKLEARHPLFKELTGILKAGKKASSLVYQLLAFSRKQMIKPVNLELNALIVDLDKMLRRLIGEDISVEIALDPHISPVKADPGQIEQILVNLVINARDAINQKTELSREKKITIETSRTILDKRYIKKHPGSVEGPYACIIVSDTGIGMNQLTRDKIFEPFFTTKDKIKGTGLGLSTVYGIVKQNNGYISVYSEQGQGTSIKIYWPESTTGMVRKKVEVLMKHVEGGDETVLFVEDNEEVRLFTVDALESLGYQVISAKNGLEAIEIFETNNHHVDLLVSDVVMPQMGGKELADSVQKLYPSVRIILTSGYTDHHIMHSGVLTDDINFLHKPYTIEQLASKVRAVLEK